MKQYAAFLALLILSGCQAEPLTSEPTTVTGEVLMVTGAFYLTRDDQGNEVFDAKDHLYVVLEETGDEVRVYVDEKTKLDLDRRVSTGDKIEATLSPDGHAFSISPAQ